MKRLLLATAGWKELMLLMSGAAVTAYLAGVVKVPVAWLLGPMIFGVAAAAWAGKPRPIHPNYQSVGQVIIGLSTGAGFTLATAKLAAQHFVPLVGVVVITVALSLLNGYLLWRWAGLDRATGFIGSLPGAASAMVAASDDLGADPIAVAVLQYMRLILVLFVAPFAVHMLFPRGNAEAVAATVIQSLPAAHWAMNAAAMALCGVVGSYVGRWLKLPSPLFMGPLFVALALAWSTPYLWNVPGWIFKVGMLFSGLSIGLRFNVPGARRLGRVAILEMAMVLVLIGLCLVVGWGFHLVAGVDTLTAVLGSTPGGFEAMVASAAELGGDPGMVVAMQMTRIFLILLTGPWLATTLLKRIAA